MRLTFLGTRGNIKIRSGKHRMHAAMMVSTRRGRLLIDCGEDWLGRVGSLGPGAILITHAHPDHAGGLKRGAPCSVYATAETWRSMARWPLAVKSRVPLRRSISITGSNVEACPVEHSLNAPAVGYRISADGARLFYVPDVARLPEPRKTLKRINVYVGDGATLTRPLVRPRGHVLIGHATVVTQLDWCKAAGVHRAVFTHCGSGIVRSDARRVDDMIRSWGRERGIDARVAYDGMTMVVRHIARK